MVCSCADLFTDDVQPCPHCNQPTKRALDPLWIRHNLGGVLFFWRHDAIKLRRRPAQLVRGFAAALRRIFSGALTDFQRPPKWFVSALHRHAVERGQALIYIHTVRVLEVPAQLLAFACSTTSWTSATAVVAFTRADVAPTSASQREVRR